MTSLKVLFFYFPSSSLKFGWLLLFERVIGDLFVLSGAWKRTVMFVFLLLPFRILVALNSVPVC